MWRFTKKKLAIAVALAVISVIAAGLFLTSSFFLTRVAFPTVRSICGIRLEIGKIDWRPWSNRLTLRNFKLGPSDAPFLEIRRIHGTYDPIQCLQGVFSFRDLDASGVKLRFERDEHTWNYERLLDQPFDDDGESDFPLRFNLRGIHVEESEIALILNDKARHFEIIWNDLNLAGRNFSNDTNTPFQATGRLMVRSSGQMDFAGRATVTASPDWDAELNPVGLQLLLQATELAGTIGGKPIHGDALTLHLEARKSDDVWHFPDVRLQQSQLAVQRSLLRGEGLWQRSRSAWRVNLSECEIAPELAAFASDWALAVNPGEVTFRGKGFLDVTPEKIVTNANWELNRKAGIAIFGREKLDFPGFRFGGEDDFTYDRKQHRLEVRKMSVGLTESDRSAIRLELRAPGQYQLDAAKGKSALQPALKLSVDRFDLQLLRFALPQSCPLRFQRGELSGNALFDLAGDLNSAVLSGEFQGKSIALNYRDFQLAPSDAQLKFHGNFASGTDSQLTLDQFEWQFSRNGQPLGNIRGNGNYSLTRQQGKYLARLADCNAATVAVFPGGDALAKKVSTVLPDFRMGGEAELNFDPAQIRLRSARLHLAAGADPDTAMLTFAPQSWSIGTRSFANDWGIQFEFSLPVTRLCKLMPRNCPMQLTNGTLSGYAALKTGADFTNTTINCRLSGTELGVYWNGRSIDDIALDQEFSCYIPENGRWQLNAGQFYCRAKGHPALRLELQASCSPESGNVDSEIGVRYINERFLNLFAPGLFAELAANGNFRLTGRNGGRTWRLSGGLAADKLRRPYNEHVMQASMELDAIREGANINVKNLGVTATDTDRTVLRLRGALAAPEQGEWRGWVTVRDFDLEPILAFLQSNPPAAEQLPAAATPPYQPIDFGTRPIRLDMDLQNIRLTPRLLTALKGNFLLRGPQLETEQAELVLNGSAMPFRLLCRDSQSGVTARGRGKLRRPVELAPIVEFIEPSYQISGELKELEWSIDASELATASWGRNFTAALKTEASNIHIVKQVAHGPVARLLLLPLEAIFRVNALIPTSVNLKRQWQEFRANVLSLSNPLANLRFAHGNANLQVQKGALKIQQFRMQGPTITNLCFTGGMRLDGDMPLALNSLVELAGMNIEMPIAGTLNHPSINLTNLEFEIAGGPLGDLIGKVAGLLPGIETQSAKTVEDTGFSLWRALGSFFGVGNSREQKK